MPAVESIGDRHNSKKQAIGDTISSIAKAAQKVHAPRYAIDMPIQPFIDIASDHIRENSRAGNTGFLDREHLYPVDELMISLNEADVVRAMYLHLLHPVDRLLSMAQKDQIDIRSLCENTSRLKGMGDHDPITKKEKNVPEVRLDACYMRVRKGEMPSFDATGLPGDTNSRTTGIIEVKAEGKIPAKDMKAAIKNPCDKAEEKFVYDQAMRIKDGDYSYFGRKGIRLVKQATWYAIARRMRHVALYDSRTMVLLFFEGMPKGQGITATELKGELVLSTKGVNMAIIEMGETYTVECSQEPDQYGPKPIVKLRGSQIARVALLGFLLQGLRDTVADKGGP
ncbi:hypothetical protein ACHAQH_005767 [Verticillium albo-atrum]